MTTNIQTWQERLPLNGAVSWHSANEARNAEIAALRSRIAELESTSLAVSPEVVALIEELRRAIGSHSAPNDCYATGPMTGNDFRDLVQCPACSAIAMYDEVMPKIKAVTSLSAQEAAHFEEQPDGTITPVDPADMGIAQPQQEAQAGDVILGFKRDELCRVADALSQDFEQRIGIGNVTGMGEEYLETAPAYASRLIRALLASQPQGEVVVTKHPDGRIVAVTRQDEEGRILKVIAEASQPSAPQVSQEVDGREKFDDWWNEKRPASGCTDFDIALLAWNAALTRVPAEPVSIDTGLLYAEQDAAANAVQDRFEAAQQRSPEFKTQERINELEDACRELQHHCDAHAEKIEALEAEVNSDQPSAPSLTDAPQVSKLLLPPHHVICADSVELCRLVCGWWTCNFMDKDKKWADVLAYVNGLLQEQHKIGQASQVTNKANN